MKLVGAEQKANKSFLGDIVFFYQQTKTDQQFSASDSCDTFEMQGLLAEEVELNLLLQISVILEGGGDLDFLVEILMHEFKMPFSRKVGKPEGDFYSLLGCHPSSSDEQILTEYRIRLVSLLYFERMTF